MSQLKTNVTLESLCFLWIILPVEDQCDVGNLCFSWVKVPMENQGDVGKFAFFIG